MKYALWVLIAFFLGLSTVSFRTRWNNERGNQYIINAAFYPNFEAVAMYARRDMTEVLREMQEAGINAIALREINVGDLVGQGHVLARPLAVFLPETRAFNRPLYDIIAPVLNQVPDISNANIVMVVPEDEVADFINERLSKRYLNQERAALLNEAPEFFRFAFEGLHYFIMHIAQINQDIPVCLGFDEDLMEKLYAMGFSFVLLPSGSHGFCDALYWENFVRIVERFDVRTIMFGTQVFGNNEAHTRRLAALMQERDMMLGVIEAGTQIGNVNQPGLGSLMESLDFQVNRAHSTINDDFVATARLRYYRWVRSVIDRNIRIMFYRPFGGVHMRNVSAADVLDSTLSTIAEFTATIESRGYTFVPYLPLRDTTRPTRANRLALGFSLSAAGVLYLAHLFRLKDKHTLILLIVVSMGCLGANMLLDWTKLYALAAAILYPTLSSLLMLLYLKTYKNHGFIQKMLLSLLIILGVNALGMFTIVASLSDIRYSVHLEMFTGVRPALFAPLLLFAVNYLMVFKDEDNLFDVMARLLLMKPNYAVVLAGMAGLVFVYISLTRAGNTPTVGPSEIELRVREVLEQMFLARPRFREILIGYPAFAVMVYLYHRYKANLLLLILGFGVMLGSASMINSFAHTFTAIYISISRTLAGLLSGAVIAAVVLVGVVLVERLFLMWYRTHRGVNT